jgi:Zn-dependent protease
VVDIMTWSLPIAHVRGIPLKVHVTFALLLLVVAAGWSPLGPAGIAFGVLLMLLLFACVTLHEFGHALAARRFGIPVREVVLLPIGGVALLGRNPRNAVQELVIAAAGPAVNVAIAALLIPVLALLNEPMTLTPALFRPAAETELSLGGALRWLLSANVGLVLFNLVPAFPLDGGRILRGALGLATDWATATRWATRTGQALAVVMGAYGLLAGHLMLALVALLVYFSAAATHADERARAVLATHRVGDACNRHAFALTEADRLCFVVRYMLTSYQPDFAVMRGPELLGVVLRSDVYAALAARHDDVPVTALMRSCPRVDADGTLADVRATLEEASVRVAAVFEGRRYLGLVGLDDIHEAEAILAFVRLREPAPASGPRAGAPVLQQHSETGA